jgi:hypothetical protein
VSHDEQVSPSASRTTGRSHADLAAKLLCTDENPLLGRAASIRGRSASTS